MTSKVLRSSLSLLFGLLVFLFWLFRHPEALSFHEQNQMFLFTTDYFMERLSVAGCLSDYISEFLVQFYYYPVCGALIIAVVMLLLQQLTYNIFKAFAHGSLDWTPFVLSFFPVLLLWALMGDENTLLSFPIALLLSLTTYLLCRRLIWWVKVFIALTLYWLVGPVFIITLTLFILDLWNTRRQHSIPSVLRMSIFILSAAIWIHFCRTYGMAQYPWKTVLSGINYYRFTIMFMEVPSGFYYTTFSFIVLPLLLLCTRLVRRSYDYMLASLCVLTAVIYGVAIDNPYEPNTYAILKQMYQVRGAKWQQIIDDAKENANKNLQAAHDPIYCTAVNLALAKTNQLSAHIFELPQVGIRGLLMPWRRENVSCVTTMEAFYHLGFVNESLRYAFDLQECVPNCRKSCRFTQRLAECNIVNGRYDVASRYIDQLKHTLFYRQWAELAETYLYNDEKVLSNGQWALMRQYRLENDFLYDYPEMDRMLGQLYLRNRTNQMAYDYFMAAVLLEGNYPSYIANLPRQPREGEDPFPNGYRKYYEYMQKQVANGNPDVVSGATATR